jgi:hypothetical protein
MAWNLLAETRYTEAGNAFMRMSTVNSWSPATYHFIAAGKPHPSLEEPMGLTPLAGRLLYGSERPR